MPIKFLGRLTQALNSRSTGNATRFYFPLAVFVTAVIVRLLIAYPGFHQLQIGGAYTADSPRYENLALTILKHGVYEAHPIVSHKGLDKNLYSGPEFFRLPGYPVLLAAIFELTGYSTSAVLIVQILLSAFTCLLVYYIGCLVHSQKLGFIAATLMVLNIRAGLHAGQVTSETLFTFLLVLALLTCIMLWRRKTLRAAVLCAIAFVLLTMTRPIGLHLTLLFALATVIVSFRNRKVLVLALVAPLAAALVLNAWCFRNYTISGVWAATSNDAITLGLWYPAEIWAHAHNQEYREGELEILRRHAEINPQYSYVYQGAKDNPSFNHVWTSGMVHDIAFAQSLRPIGYRVMLEEWKTSVYTFASGGIWSLFSGLNEWRNWIISNDEYQAMGRYILNAKKSLARLEIGPATLAIVQILKETPLLTLIVFAMLAVLNAVLLTGAVVGLRPLLITAPTPYGWVVILWTLYLLATAGPSGNNRYLAPMLPLLSLWAAFGILAIATRFRPHTRGNTTSGSPSGS